MFQTRNRRIRARDLTIRTHRSASHHPFKTGSEPWNSNSPVDRSRGPVRACCKFTRRFRAAGRDGESRARGRGDERGRRFASRRAHTSTMTSSRFFASTRPAPGAPDGGLEARVRALLRDVRRCHRRRRRSRDASPTDPTRPTTSLARAPSAGRAEASHHARRLPPRRRARLLPDVRRAMERDGHRVPTLQARLRRRVVRRPGRHLATTRDRAENLARTPGRRRRRRGGRPGVGAGGDAVRGVRLGEDEATTLLCDGCNAARHMACCVPPLREVPSGDWFCPACAAASEEDEDEPSASDEGDGREEGGEGCLPARRGRAGESPSKPKDQPEGREPNGGASAPNDTFEMFRFAR